VAARCRPPNRCGWAASAKYDSRGLAVAVGEADFAPIARFQVTALFLRRFENQRRHGLGLMSFLIERNESDISSGSVLALSGQDLSE